VFGETMGAATDYFRHIKDAVVTIFDGMAVSASHLMRRPYTIQYPDRTPLRVQDTLPFRYRGILDVDLEICTGCLACERACPIDCIVIVCEKNAQTRELTISQFDIDIAKCMYCGLCSEPCPTGSIHHTTEFEGADFSLESLIRRYVPEPVVAYKVKKGPEPDAHVGHLLERGMRYVDEWAQPGGAPSPAAARPTSPAASTAVAAKPVAAKSEATASPPGAAAPAPGDDAAQSASAAGAAEKSTSTELRPPATLAGASKKDPAEPA
jgi:NADH-quinone oxidoreductase subunit I